MREHDGRLVLMDLGAGTNEAGRPQFGTPCYVSVNAGRSGTRVLSLTYPSFTVQIMSEEERLSPDSIIAGVTIQNANGLANSCDSNYGYGVPWRGFASVDVYEAESYRGR